jgi:hypothetical protein
MYEEFIGDVKSDLDFEVKVTGDHGGRLWLIAQ